MFINSSSVYIGCLQGVFAFLELVEPHSLYRVVNQNFEEYVIEFLSSLMLSSRSSLIHVISDHGLHYTDYSKTEMGLLDHKVPFWYMIAPDNILKDCEQQKAYLTENEKKRVSWVDFYRTFIESHSLGECNSKAEARMGVPLHLDPVPRNRTCSQAGVPEHLCLLNLPLNPCDQQDMDLPNKIVEYMLKKNPEDQCIKPKPHQVGIDKYLCYYQSNAHAEILASVKLRDKSLTYQVSLGENMEINGIKPDFTYGNMVTQCRGKVKSLETCICEKGL